jgi:hypothetical protein
MTHDDVRFGYPYSQAPGPRGWLSGALRTAARAPLVLRRDLAELLEHRGEGLAVQALDQTGLDVASTRECESEPARPNQWTPYAARQASVGALRVVALIGGSPLVQAGG